MKEHMEATVIQAKYDGDLEVRLREEIDQLEEKGNTVIDVKYQMVVDTNGEQLYSALILSKKASTEF